MVIINKVNTIASQRLGRLAIIGLKGNLLFLRYGFVRGGSLISWYSKKQSVPAKSSAEAEYYAAVSAANEPFGFFFGIYER